MTRASWSRGTGLRLVAPPMRCWACRTWSALGELGGCEACRTGLRFGVGSMSTVDWASTQNNLGNALAALGERESGTARLEQAVVAWDACLRITASV